MKYEQRCGECGHKKIAYTHTLNKPLVSALAQLVEFAEMHGKPANLQKNLELTKNQYNNFQKLQYFGLVRRTDSGWSPTQLGIEFIHGREKVWNRVMTIESEVLDHSHEAWVGSKKYPVLMGVSDFIYGAYKQKVEYQTEKREQMRVL